MTNLITLGFEPPFISAITAQSLLSSHGKSLVEFLRSHAPEDLFNHLSVMGYLGYNY